MKKLALVVGIDHPEDARIRPLLYAVDDARQMANMLEQAGHEVRYLADKTADQLVRELERLVAGAGRGDQVLVYFSGHGVEVNGRHLLLCVDARPDLLGSSGRGGVWVDELKVLAGRNGASRALVLDTCREPLLKVRASPAAMAGTRGLRDLVTPDASDSGESAGGLALVCACDEGETAQECEAFGHGLFSHALVACCKESLASGGALELDQALVNEVASRMQAEAQRHRLSVTQRPWAVYTGIAPVLVLGQPGAAKHAAAQTAASQLAVLDVASDPSGAEVVLDGGAWKVTAPAEIEGVPWGEHHYRARLSGETQKGRFDVRDFDHRLEVRFPAVLERLARERAEREAAEAARQAREREEQARRVAAAEAERRRTPAEGQVWTIEDLAMAFQPVAAGEFMMGSEDGESNEKPVHQVHQVHLARGFWLGRTPVTQAQWRAVMGDTPSHFKGDDLPVEQVDWNRCLEFCARLTTRERNAGRLAAAFAFRLPTEAEWEYAARGGAGSRGYPYAGGGDLGRVGWYDKNSGDKTHPVGQKTANELGLHDMSGNVWEWCLDDWHYSYKGAPSDGSRWGDGSGSSRVIRGGSWCSAAQYFRAAYRLRGEPGDRGIAMGFRVALSSVLSGPG